MFSKIKMSGFEMVTCRFPFLVVVKFPPLVFEPLYFKGVNK